MAIIKSLSEKDYNEMPGVRSSVLTIIDRQTLAHARYAIDNFDSKDTPDMLQGRAAHDFILRNSLFANKWGVYPEGHNGTTKEGKEEKKRLSDIYGTNLLKYEAFKEILDYKKSIDSHPSIKSIFDNIVDTELTVTWDENGIPCKARLDAVAVIQDRVIVIDFKTSRSADSKHFESACVNYGYLIQSAHYLRGAKANGLIDKDNNDFVHVVIEKEPPFLPAIYCLDDASLELGEQRREIALQKYSQAMQTGIWSGYSDKVETIAAPHWYFQQQEYSY
jgi:hypothetical protein